MPSDHILDPKIAEVVRVLQANGVETIQSCQGGQGHSYHLPTVEFRGVLGEGMRALGIALIYGMPVTSLRKEWTIIDKEPTGPIWAMEFNPRLLPIQSVPEEHLSIICSS